MRANVIDYMNSHTKFDPAIFQKINLRGSAFDTLVLIIKTRRYNAFLSFQDPDTYSF